MTKKEFREDLKGILSDLSQDGFNCFMTKRDDASYGYAITPSDNVLYIEHDYFYGWNVSLQYKPSHKNGSGCRCNEEPLTEINSNVILEQEKECLNYARKLEANLYNSSEEFFSKYWDKDNLEKI